MRARIEFSHAAGDLDMVLVSPDLRVVDRSQRTGDEESVGTSSTDAGRYLFAVYGYRGARGGYRLLLEVDGVADDSFEENDSIAAAASIGAGDHALELIDEDWYRVEASRGQTLSADILFRHAAGDLDLSLHAADGSVLATSESTSDQERVSATASADGAFLVRAYGYRGAQGSYELRLRLSDPAPRPGSTTGDDPTVRGPHAVGEVRGTIFDADRQKNIDVILHYPATADGVGTPIATGSGPFSLLAHGHGRFGAAPVDPPNMLGWNYLYEHVSSHGFYVIAPNLDINSVAPEPAGWHREQIVVNGEDLKYGLTFMIDAGRSSSSSFAGTVDAGRVGVVGHSRGGEAALYVGRTDSRVRTVTAIAPTDFHRFPRIGKPILLFNATHDCDVIPSIQQSIFDRLSDPIRLVTIVGGGHFLWTESAGPICFVPIDRAEQHRITLHYVLSFQDVHLRGDPRFDSALHEQVSSTRIQVK